MPHAQMMEEGSASCSSMLWHLTAGGFEPVTFWLLDNLLYYSPSPVDLLNSMDEQSVIG